MFGFGKKCEYCRTKIEKGKEIKRNVKVPGYIGTRPRDFCTEEHAKKYEQEAGEHMERQGGGGCCG